MNDKYTTKLGSGQGLINETIMLLDLWQPGMEATVLNRVALESGMFPNITARRLRNIVYEGFAPRYLGKNGDPAIYLKILRNHITSKEFNQILFLITCRSHKILYDFIEFVYWNAYSSGRATLSTEESREFVIRANQDGKTSKPWGESMIERVPIYLIGTCSDFGLLEDGRKKTKKILPFRIESRVAIFLAYDLHFSGIGDNSVLSDLDWGLFGMDRSDVLDELKRQALKGYFIIQSAGEVTRIEWKYKNMEEMVNAFTKG